MFQRLRTGASRTHVICSKVFFQGWKCFWHSFVRCVNRSICAGMIACGFVLMTTLWLPCSAGDWPCFRGPNADGVSLEKDWLTQWPENGPPVLWRTEVGTGYSAVVVVDNRLFTMGNRENRDTVYCLDASSGEELWKHTYDCPTDANEFEGGPTSTPTVHDGKVYTLSRTGNLFCFDAATGNVKWAIDVPEMTSIRIPGWGFSSCRKTTNIHVLCVP